MLELFGINVKDLTEEQLLERMSVVRTQIARFGSIGKDISQLYNYLEQYSNEYQERLFEKNKKLIDKYEPKIIDSETHGKNDINQTKETTTKTTRIKKFGGELIRKDRT